MVSDSVAGVERAEEPNRVGEQRSRRGLAHQRAEERLLAFDAGKVAAVAEAAARPDERQALLAVHPADAGRQVQTRQRVVHRTRQAHLDAAQGVHGLLEGREVDHDEVLHRKTRGASVTVRMVHSGPPTSNAELKRSV